jgi:hypothetical protein
VCTQTTQSPRGQSLSRRRQWANFTTRPAGHAVHVWAVAGHEPHQGARGGRTRACVCTAERGPSLFSRFLETLWTSLKRGTLANEILPLACQPGRHERAEHAIGATDPAEGRPPQQRRAIPPLLNGVDAYVEHRPGVAGRARPNRLIGRGWPKLGAAWGMVWR